jgi:hypothetical protein
MRGFVNVNIRVDEVLDEMSDQELIDELKERRVDFTSAALESLRKADLETLKEAVNEGDVATVFDLLKVALNPGHALDQAKRISLMQRDPSTGRPVIQ